MKRSALVVMVAVAICGCSKHESARSRVDRAAASDPDKLALDAGFNSYVRRSSEVRECEIGVIQLGNGERVKYWFVSHHVSRDKGCTKFHFADGSVRYLDGAFCCEVQLADQQPADRPALEAFLDACEGIDPAAGAGG